MVAALNSKSTFKSLATICLLTQKLQIRTVKIRSKQSPESCPFSCSTQQEKNPPQSMKKAAHMTHCDFNSLIPARFFQGRNRTSRRLCWGTGMLKISRSDCSFPGSCRQKFKAAVRARFVALGLIISVLKWKCAREFDESKLVSAFPVLRGWMQCYGPITKQMYLLQKS